MEDSYKIEFIEMLTKLLMLLMLSYLPIINDSLIAAKDPCKPF
jgi:hypothetical protein